MPPLRRGEARRFASALAGGGVRVVFAHSSYLINLASADARVRARSVASLGEELRRCAALGLPYLVLHPGAHGGQGERIGIRLIAAGLDDAFQADPGGATRVLLETTAGQGSVIGWRFEHLAAIIASSANPARLGVCLDTCHLFAAGYDLRSRAGYAGTMGEFERAVGLGRIRAFHLNDCMGGLGSRMDRHAHIGEGRLGLAAFARLLNDARFSGLPMVLETPKGKGTAFDRRNLAVLRRLLGRGAGRPAGARAAPSPRG